MIVSFHGLAKRELIEAAQYYESESTGLGQAFVSRSSVASMKSFGIQRLPSSYEAQYVDV